MGSFPGSRKKEEILSDGSAARGKWGSLAGQLTQRAEHLQSKEKQQRLQDAGFCKARGRYSKKSLFSKPAEAFSVLAIITLLRTRWQ